MSGLSPVCGQLEVGADTSDRWLKLRTGRATRTTAALSIGGFHMDPPPKARQQFTHVVRFDPREIRNAVHQVEGINAKIALVITRTVGTMACAYVFALIALISLPAAINSGQVIIIVAWVAQTFLQLVLLSIIMVGQSVQSATSDARAVKEFADTETILDRLDVNTAGGIKEVLDAIHALGGSAAAVTAGGPGPEAS
jgi:hypothetical protein